MNRIYLHNIEVEGRHGVFPDEKETPRTFTVSVELEVDGLERAAASDDLADTVDYARVGHIVRDVIQGPSRDLLEALAGEMLARIGALDGVRAATVRVSKPTPPGMDVHVERVEVAMSQRFD